MQELSKSLQKEPSLTKEKCKVLLCAMCEYPFKTLPNLRSHQEKHKKRELEGDISQDCGICGSEFLSNNEFRNHIKIKYTLQFKCQICDFQGSSQIILTKHTNLKHRTLDAQENGTLKCSHCNEQFSSKWNLNNHMRDNHTKTEVCIWFKNGKCQFPESDCWNIHEASESKETHVNEDIKCHTCKRGFKTKNDMMMHRLKDHRDKVKNCRDIDNCRRQSCWYKHEVTKTSASSKENESSNEWVENELDSENSDFPEASNQPAPPTKS